MPLPHSLILATFTVATRYLDQLLRKLNKKSGLKESDDFIVLEKLGENETRYFEIEPNLRTGPSCHRSHLTLRNNIVIFRLPLSFRG